MFELFPSGKQLQLRWDFIHVCLFMSADSPGYHGYLQRLKATILEAQTAHQQHRMARQKSQRFLKTTINQ